MWMMPSSSRTVMTRRRSLRSTHVDLDVFYNVNQDQTMFCPVHADDEVFSKASHDQTMFRSICVDDDVIYEICHGQTMLCSVYVLCVVHVVDEFFSKVCDAKIALSLDIRDFRYTLRRHAASRVTGLTGQVAYGLRVRIAVLNFTLSHSSHQKKTSTRRLTRDSIIFGNG